MAELHLSKAQMRMARQARDQRFDGLFFVGVLSTGIFCRPICPAKMAKEDNVNYYTNAVQAIDAGYRPCKLCKPDIAPAHKHSLAVDPLVEKATSIIQKDPSLTITDIAHRCAVSDRYLRERFLVSLGLPPSKFLRSTQIQFAKQLLQQTRMPIIDVAVAAGFKSSRSLQQAFQQQFNMTPSSFRRTEKEESHLDTRLFLAYRPPYLWKPLSTFLAKRSIPNVEQVDENSYTRFFTINGQACQVKAVHNSEKHGFDVTLRVPNPVHLKPVLANLARVLDCDANWFSIEGAIAAAGFDVTDETRGIRIPGVWDIYEAGCRAILGQQVSVAAAINKTQQLVQLVNEHEDVVGFPQPADVSASIIEKMGMPNARKQTLIRFTEYMQNPDNYAKVESGATEGLLDLKGIGPWTCQYVLMRGTSHPDIWMPKDLAILRQCEKFDLTPDAAKPWSSYLTLVLWHDYMENT